jgi:hypothetical protein
MIDDCRFGWPLAFQYRPLSNPLYHYRPHCSGQQGAYRPGSTPVTAPTVLDNSTRITALDLFQLPPPLFWTTGGLPPWIYSSYRLHCSGQQHGDYRPGLVPVTAPTVLDNSTGITALDLLQLPPPLFWTTARGLPPWTPYSSYRPHCSGQQHGDLPPWTPYSSYRPHCPGSPVQHGDHRPGFTPVTAHYRLGPTPVTLLYNCIEFLMQPTYQQVGLGPPSLSIAASPGRYHPRDGSFASSC